MIWRDRDRRHTVKVWFLLGTRGSLEFSALDLDAVHLLAEELLAAQKAFVVVRARVWSSG